MCFFILTVMALVNESSAQISGCNLGIPPFSVNGVDVSHSWIGNIEIPVDAGNDNYALCSNPNYAQVQIDPIVALGDDNPNFEFWNPFKYTLHFSQPINSLQFILFGSFTGFFSIDFGAENFVFETNESNIDLEEIYACNELISGDTIFLGMNNNIGDGLFSIAFDCPVYGFSISGKGGGSGSGFKICTNSLVTPNLWGRVSGDSLVCGQDSVLFEVFGGLAPYTFSYSVNGGGVQTLQSASNEVWLPTPTLAGIYNFELLQVQDAADSIAVIACNNNHTIEVMPPPNAQFGLSPSSGAAPLDVQITNNSSNASDFSWYINNEFLGSELTNYTLEEPGSYELKLVATLDSFSCSDSVIQTISVFSTENTTFQIGPNPNNGTFSIITNDLSLENANIKIYNTLGAIISEGIYAFEQGKINQSIVLASGVYFVEILALETNQKVTQKMVVYE